MQLYLIRHCQSANNALWLRTGSANGRSADPPLTDLGHRQAQHLARTIAGGEGLQLTHLYCSLMRRSIETGQYIATEAGLPLVARDDLHERGGIYLQDPETGINNGLPGPNRTHFAETYPDLILPDSLGEEGWWNRSYESREMALHRAQRMLDWLLKAHDGSEDSVGLVIHGGFIQSIFSALFQVPLLEANFSKGREVWIRANNGSITRIDFAEDVIRLHYVNQFEFFPNELVT
jgi:2,3-bisphosphoglycerate-dependent phosphoglycerate mutase